MFIVTITKVENNGIKKWIDFLDIKSGKYTETQLPQNYTVEEFSKVKSYYSQLIQKTAAHEFLLREIIQGPNSNFISIRIALSQEIVSAWREDFSSLVPVRDEILEMINATMTYKDVQYESFQDILNIVESSYNQINSLYFQS